MLSRSVRDAWEDGRVFGSFGFDIKGSGRSGDMRCTVEVGSCSVVLVEDECARMGSFGLSSSWLL